jgi:hypothetical protein
MNDRVAVWADRTKVFDWVDLTLPGSSDSLQVVDVDETFGSFAILLTKRKVAHGA